MLFRLALLAFLYFGLVGCMDPVTSPSSPEIPESAEPIRPLNVGFLIMDGVYNTELTAPMDVFQHTIFHHDHGLKVFTIAATRDTVRSFEGLHILPDYGFMTDAYPAIDILVVPSAEHHLDTDLENQTMLAFVRTTANQAALVLSLCDGAFVLAEAGLLEGLTSTTFPGDLETYRQRYPDLKVRGGVSFVHDGKYITSAGGAKSFDAALYMVSMIFGPKTARGVAEGLVLDPNLKKVQWLRGKKAQGLQ